ncbi:3616_t:CDS:2 [Funneliformis caledonium]|uniref:3616_t:CDS:1 n=1 Tax=Funneliformis caledonium TaxID=1117310 RepID=A0A9N9BHQ8_9GLOM|nr:3616_t:CDS:2 [Funneliformis caledonium]
MSQHLHPIISPNTNFSISCSTSLPITANTVPVEIFIEICRYLSPTDLFSLMEVCKQFRCWLSSTTSKSTREIWCTSRKKFLPKLQLAPFSDMNEQSYMRLGLIEKGCQFCKGKVCKVYWVFRVRSCKKCFSKRIVSHRDLPSEAMFLVDVYNCLPYMERGPDCIYWHRDVIAACRELKELRNSNPEKQAEWIGQKKLTAQKIMENYKKRRSDQNLLSLSLRKKDKRQFERIIHELKEERLPDGNSKYLDRWIWNLQSCDDAFQLSREPFVQKDWKVLKRAMIVEYEELMKQRRRLQICNAILTLLTTSSVHENALLGNGISVSDPLIGCIRWCPSYQNPPFFNNDPRIPWDDQYLSSNLIQKLRDEAQELRRLPGQIKSGPITTVFGALSLGCEKCEIFMCKLCQSEHFNYHEACHHLKGSKHNVVTVLPDDMISVDRNKVIECIPLIYPFDGSPSETLQHYRHWHV